MDISRSYEEQITNTERLRLSVKPVRAAPLQNDHHLPKIVMVRQGFFVVTVSATLDDEGRVKGPVGSNVSEVELDGSTGLGHINTVQSGAKERKIFSEPTR